MLTSPAAMRQRIGRFSAAAVAIGAAIALKVWVASAADPPVVDPPEPRLLAAGPLLGYAGHDSIAIWAQPATPTAALEVACSLLAADGAEEKRVRFPPPGSGPGQTESGAGSSIVRLSGLAPGATYRYRVLVDGRSDEGTSGEFRLAPPPGTPVRATFGVVSCMNARRHPSQPAWSRLLDEAPDLLLQLGDNIYANSTRPPAIRGWYTAQRRVPQYARLLLSTPVLATWDDHDFGANDSDGTLPGKERSLAVFRELWPNPSAGRSDAPGVFFRAAFGDVDIFMLDGRYHRSPNSAPDDEWKTMLGATQFDWLERELRASRAIFKLVCSGSVIGTGVKDCWSLYTRDRERLLGITREVPGIVFLSGDIHSSLVARYSPGPLKAGYPIYEAICSGVAVNQLTHFFTTLVIDTAAADPTIAARVHRVDSAGEPAGVEERVIRRSELTPAF